MHSTSSPFALPGKVALVTGAARGIGAACAHALAEAGARVMVTDVLDGPARELAADIRARGGQADVTALDVTDEAQWERAVRDTVERCGGLDILVNNAGIEIFTPLATMSLADWRRLQAVNVDGVFLGLKHAILAMRPGGVAGRGGAVINISSVTGMVGFPGAAAYSASKGAVRMLTKSAALECAQGAFQIRVNSVHPGVIRTAMADNLEAELVSLGLAATNAEAARLMESLHPIGRLGEPVDVARVVQFLASDAARFVTGSEYVVDGGFTAR